MTGLLQGPGRAARTFALLVALMFLPATAARAQYFGYGGYGGGFAYGYPGYGYGYPGIGYGYGFPGVGYGYGYPGVGYGYGFPGMSFGYGYGYPGYGYGYPGFRPYITAGTGPGMYNPLFGVGLSPLGVQSALAEASMRAGAAPPSTAVEVRVAPGTLRTNSNPKPNVQPNTGTIRPK